MNLTVILQIIIAIGLLNVWLVRYSKSTDYRGGSAKNLKEEFLTYGLPKWFYYLIGTLKISAAVLLIAGIWISSLVFFAASLVSLLMLGALIMHVKVKDPIKKSVPALLMLVMSSLVIYGSL